jgi:hypothetical protein
VNIKLDLTLDEINAILAVLGNCPTAQGVYPLFQKIKEQAEMQLPKEPVQ